MRTKKLNHIATITLTILALIIFSGGGFYVGSRASNNTTFDDQIKCKKAATEQLGVYETISRTKFIPPGQCIFEASAYVPSTEQTPAYNLFTMCEVFSGQCYSYIGLIMNEGSLKPSKQASNKEYLQIRKKWFGLNNEPGI